MPFRHFAPGFGGIIMLLIMFLTGALLGNIVPCGIIISYPIMFIPVLLYASVQSRLNEHRVSGVPLDRNCFTPYGGFKLSSIAILATVAMAYVTEPVTNLLPPMPQWMEELMKKMLEDNPVWVTLVSVSVFAPFFEELLCRGFVLRGLLSRNTHPMSAIMVSAAFFAILHANPWQAIPAFLFGSLFGYVYYRTGSLKLTMLMHCTNNTLAVVVAHIPQLKDAETFMDVLSPWAYWCIYAACAVILACTVAVFKGTSVSRQELWNPVCPHR